MAVSIHTLSFNTSGGYIYQPALRKSTGLKSLLLQYEAHPPVRGLEKQSNRLSTADSEHAPRFHGHRLMRWRSFQFRDPDDTYVYRARIEPHPPQLPGDESKQHNVALPSRGPPLKRPSSVGGNTCRSSPPTTNGVVSPSRYSTVRPQMTSSNDVNSTSPNKQNGNGAEKQTGLEVATGQVMGSEFTVSAKAMSIQPRQGTQRSQVTSKSIKQHIVNAATFPYPDPSKVKGNPGFVSRLAELARLEAETIRSEQAKARLMSARSRPTSARSLKSSIPSSAAASSKSSYQLPNRRMSLNAGTSRVPSMIKRMNSSPAIGTYTHRGGGGAPSVAISISKQVSCRTQSRKSNGELEPVDEATSKSDISLLNDKVKQPNDSISAADNECRVQRLTSTPSLLCPSEGIDDDAEVQRSCSPPIVFIKIPRCSWTVGESNDSNSEVASPPRREENVTGHNKEDCQNSESKAICECTTGTNRKDHYASLSLSTALTQDSMASNHNDVAGNYKSLVHTEDDLKVTSDLGLSIDSLHLSQEDSTEPTTTVNMSPDPCSFAHSKPGMELESDQSPTVEKSITEELAPGGSKMDEPIARTAMSSDSKKTRKRGGKRTIKVPSSSSTMVSHDVSSSSLISLKGNKSIKNGHKSVKKYTKHNKA